MCYDNFPTSEHRRQKKNIDMRLFKIKSLFLISLFILVTAALALPPEWPEDGIIVEPDMGRTPLIAALKDAKKSLQISAYKLEDDALIAELGDAVKRGVKVNVLVTRSIFKRPEEKGYSGTPAERLQEMGINVRESPAFYSQTHHKHIIVDNEYALVGTGNMAKGCFDETSERKAERDFWTTVTDKNQLKELGDVFIADFNGHKTDLKHALLVWSPDQARTPFLNFFASAKKSIWIYQQDIEDAVLAHALADAARKGIDVHLIMSPYPFSKTKDGNIPHQEMIRQAGGKVGLITHVICHAKVVLVDAETEFAKALVGSSNFYPPSLEENRELGIILSHPSAVAKISSVFKSDYAQANFNPRQ